MLNDRPIRIRFDGIAESYDYATDQWLIDWLRDPREYIGLIPPQTASPGSIRKGNSVNAAVYQLRAAAEIQYPVAASSPFDGDTLYFYIQRSFYWLGLADGGQTAELFFALATPIVTEWQITGGDTIHDDMTSTIWDKVVCHLWCHISDDGSYTKQNWVNLIQAIVDDTSLLDAQNWLRLSLILAGRKGLTNLGYLRVNDGDVLDPSTDCEPCP